MAILARNVDDLVFEFTCPQWALMSDASKLDWTVLENTCGIQTTIGNPYASSSFVLTLQGRIEVDTPLTLTVVDGVYTIGINLPEWKTYKGTIASNKVIVPTINFILPANQAGIYAIVRRQQYHTADDYTVNTTDNSLEFLPGLNLNGQIVYVHAFV